MGLKIISNCYIHNLPFSGEPVAITLGVENTNYMSRKTEEEYEKLVRKISYEKTEYLRTDLWDELEINGNKTKAVKNFKYLGSILKDNGSSDGEIEKKRISETRKVISMLNSILFSKNILRETKKLIYKTTVKCILTYGAETCTSKQKHENALLATEMD
jgi:hypothetical protein